MDGNYLLFSEAKPTDAGLGTEPNKPKNGRSVCFGLFDEFLLDPVGIDHGQACQNANGVGGLEYDLDADPRENLQ